jgi:hypothetical protein
MKWNYVNKPFKTKAKLKATGHFRWPEINLEMPKPKRFVKFKKGDGR